ncbi:MAG: glycosyltransferase family 2 protein [Candidatus Bathyarchaeia archaeon]
MESSRKSNPEPGHESRHAHVAVCIPFNNREDTLPFTLNSIINNGYHKSRVSIVLYDDGSTDNSGLIAKDFIKVHGSMYSKVIYGRSTVPSRGNIAKARNGCFGLARDTQAQYLISVDSDVEMPADAIQGLVDLMEKDRRIGMASVPYTYARHSSGAAQALEVDVTLGCTIISRELLDRIDWKIDERFDKVDDLWLGAQAEKLGFKIMCHNQSRALHLKPIAYRDHLKKRLFEVPHYHYLLLKEGLLTRRLKRTYAYYTAWLLSLVFCLANPSPGTDTCRTAGAWGSPLPFTQKVRCSVTCRHHDDDRACAQHTARHTAAAIQVQRISERSR